MLARRSHVLLVWLIFVAVIAAYGVMAARYPLAYIWATYEDLYGEWAQFYLFVAAFGFALSVAVVRSRYRWFFVVLALACFYTFMEEISWGQRVLGFPSPEFFKSRNLQGETNLHNFLVGPYATDLKQLIEFLVALALFGYGFAYPFLLRLGWRPIRWLDAKGLAAPPLYLSPLFVLAAYLELGPFSFNEAEVAEILVGLALAIMGVHYLFGLRRGLDLHRSRTWPGGGSTHLSGRLAIVVLAVLAMAVGTTEAIYATPEGKARAESRIDSGAKKFARRYSRYEQWDTTVDLFEYLHKRDPGSTFVLRQLAAAHLKTGNQVAYREYVEEALEVALARHRRDPESTSAHRNVARAYRMKGDEDKAEFHLAEALRIARERVEKKPESASAAYTLGRTYALMDRPAEALAHYKRAYELRPTSSKYRKAYLRLRTRMGD